MKKVITGVVLAACIAAVAGAQSWESSAREEVLAAQKKFYQAYQSCDAKAMEPLVVDDLIYWHSTGGVQRSKADLLKGLTPNCTIELLRVDVTNVRIYGDTAILFGDLYFKAKNGAPTAGGQIASQVFIKRNGRWLFAHNISSEPVPLDTSVRLKAEKK